MKHIILIMFLLTVLACANTMDNFKRAKYFNCLSQYHEKDGKLCSTYIRENCPCFLYLDTLSAYRGDWSLGFEADCPECFNEICITFDEAEENCKYMK